MNFHKQHRVRDSKGHSVSQVIRYPCKARRKSRNAHMKTVYQKSGRIAPPAPDYRLLLITRGSSKISYRYLQLKLSPITSEKATASQEFLPAAENGFSSGLVEINPSSKSVLIRCLISSCASKRERFTEYTPP